jgi:glutathione S-transferase
VHNLAGRWLKDVERRLEDRGWIACADFTVADIMMACALCSIRETDLMEPFPRIKADYERCLARRLAAHPRPLRQASRRERRRHPFAPRQPAPVIGAVAPRRRRPAPR